MGQQEFVFVADHLCIKKRNNLVFVAHHLCNKKKQFGFRFLPDGFSLPTPLYSCTLSWEL
jgi:hypothetical protein